LQEWSRLLRNRTEPYRSALRLTHPRPLAEDSQSDFVWGARDPGGGYGGQNLLGLALICVRDELIADVRTRPPNPRRASRP
jgi:predicted NAD-dependent protein-ADP-ribosyltransferase YbiA (DUF1768 family)